jgi:Zn-dependent protease with chaperone function
MTVAAVLLAYAVGAGTLGPRLLARARWTQRAPLLAIVTYLAAAWSVVAAAGLAGLALAVHATALGSGLSQLIGACVIRLRDTYATATHLRAVRRQARQHAQAVRLVGRPDLALGVLLVEHPQAAAYCVAGPDPAVIVTTAALQALDQDQLAAVLAHERAHLAWHHHRLVALARIARQLLPFLPLMRDASAQVAQLVELHADDTATAAHDTRTLATALVVLAERGGLTPGPAGLGAGGMTAAGAEAMQRIQRMIRPAEPLGRVRRQLLRAGAAGLALTPLLLALTPAMVALALGRVPVA